MTDDDIEQLIADKLAEDARRTAQWWAIHAEPPPNDETEPLAPSS